MKRHTAGVMYGLFTLITDFIMDFITDFSYMKVSYKVHKKVGNESMKVMTPALLKN